MSHKTFVQIIHASTEIILRVQPYDDYIRANPQVLQNPHVRPPTETKVNNNNNNKMDNLKRQTSLSKALTKLTGR